MGSAIGPAPEVVFSEKPLPSPFEAKGALIVMRLSLVSACRGDPSVLVLGYGGGEWYYLFDDGRSGDSGDGARD